MRFINSHHKAHLHVKKKMKCVPQGISGNNFLLSPIELNLLEEQKRESQINRLCLLIRWDAKVSHL